MSSEVLVVVILALLAVVSSAHGVSNLVITWTTATTNAIAAGGGFPPRVYALTQLSIYRTLTTSKMYKFKGASKVAAGNFAAHYVLSSMYPSLQNSIFDIAMASELSKLTLSANAMKQSRNLGRYHALVLLRAMLDDGTFNYLAFSPADPITAADGEYVFTPNQTVALVSNYQQTRPIIPSFKIKNYDLGGPYNVNSAEFQADLEEVRSLGSSSNSSARTPFQTETALFYISPTGGGIQGFWYSIARHYISPQFPNLTPLETSRIYTLIAMAQFHASIVTSSQKYKYLYWRPITAIRKRADASWNPLRNTPGHPEYPSGHSITCSASAAALAAAVKFTVDTSVQNFSAPSMGLPSRYFTNLRAIVDQCGDSRVLVGAHFRKACDDANTIGYKIGKDIVDKFVYKI